MEAIMDFRIRNLASGRHDDALERRTLCASAQFALLAFAALALSSSPATAHDIYSGLYSNYGTACCDDSDCRPARYRVISAGVQMQVDQRWISVPPSAIQYRILSGDRGETGGGHWCGRRAHDVEVLNDPLGNGYFTFCAILPPGFAALKGSR
jgi:hypothetical protein